MGGVYRKSRHHAGDKRCSKAAKTKHYQRDLDQIHEDVARREHVLQRVRETAQQSLVEQGESVFPGVGQFYCLECARFFMDSHSIASHRETKAHRRRAKLLLKEKPYSVKESEWAAGMTSTVATTFSGSVVGPSNS